MYRCTELVWWRAGRRRRWPSRSSIPASGRIYTGSVAALVHSVFGVIFGSLSDPGSLSPDPDPALKAEYRSGSVSRV